ncbi:MAG: type I methionyl aminopeptidase [Candidatus Cardinium sp.]|uniref:type I methionyl aminopeptidase n=1 Tax=Cardinium endosymbiont of Dermatophagoides farinae TaxID=2597823 RepID=UPI00118378FE|nr:type I methionyl aminopeptidase [Cardinium endosymbiont of Dermatophagoides farinae]TSJ80760.1 type I methionyl aminopeptidase [Cardinium endosymbiont of Dermatophagoides farinae]UWW96758.1 MAG: type I methionyl aminopeptidase [Candidatus Cardinium sp.]
MIKIRTGSELKLLQRAGHIVALCHDLLKNTIQPGVDSLALDTMVEEVIRSNGAEPIFKGYRGFPNATCVSINDGVVHGIPNNRLLQEGDIVSIDIGVKYKGYIGDSAWTYPIGKISDEKKFLLAHTEKALWEGLRVIKAGIHLSTISHAIGHYATQHKLSIVKELGGHGVGTMLHESPQIPNYGKPSRGPILKAGMVLAIEPILNLGYPAIKTLQDGWTIVTKDGKDSAHFEHTIAVEEEGYTILTNLMANAV